MMTTKEKRIELELMKRRLTYKGKQVFIKSLSSNYAIVSYNKDTSNKKFKVDVKHLADLK